MLAGAWKGLGPGEGVCAELCASFMLHTSQKVDEVLAAVIGKGVAGDALLVQRPVCYAVGGVDGGGGVDTARGGCEHLPRAGWRMGEQHAIVNQCWHYTCIVRQRGG